MFRECFEVETLAKQSRHPIEIHAVGMIHEDGARYKEEGDEEGNRRRKKADIRGIFISTQNDSFLILNSFRSFDFFLPPTSPSTSAWETVDRGETEGNREGSACRMNVNFRLSCN